MLSEIDAALEIPGEEKRLIDVIDSEERKSQEAYARKVADSHNQSTLCDWM